MAMILLAPKKSPETLVNYTVDQVAAYVYSKSITVRTMVAFRGKDPVTSQVAGELEKYKLVDCYNYVRNAMKESERVIGSRLVECALMKAKAVEISDLNASNFNLPPQNTPVVVSAVTTTTTTTNTTTTSSTTTTSTTTTTTAKSTVLEVAVEKPLVVTFTTETDRIDVELFKGFPIVTPALQTRLIASSIPAMCSPPSLVDLAVTIADFVTIEKAVWTPKSYGKVIIEASTTYQNIATAISMELQSAIGLDDKQTKSYRGTNLVNFIVQSLLFIKHKSTSAFARISHDIHKVIPKKVSYNLVTKLGQLTAKETPFEFTAKLLELCRGIRGGDENDNTPLGTSYYLGVALPRPLMKALILLKDCNHLLASVGGYKGIFFTGTKSSKKVHALAMLGLHKWMFGGTCAPPVGYVPLNDGSGAYKHPNFSSIFYQHCQRAMVTINFGVVPPAKFNYYNAYEVQIDANNYDYTLPSCAIHTLRGFLTSRRVNTVHPKDWLNAVRTINVHRTFSCHQLTYKQIVKKFPFLNTYTFKLSALGAVSRNLGITFDSEVLEGTSMYIYKDIVPEEFALPPPEQPLATMDEQPAFMPDSGSESSEDPEEVEPPIQIKIQHVFSPQQEEKEEAPEGAVDELGNLYVA